MQKLELTWIGKEEAQQPLEPRILIENPQYSYGNVEEATLPNGKPWHGNMLIHGDNLLALKALEANFSGQVKCIYIDPPYNTGNAFEHYDDMLEHSIWLSLMRSRLEILWKMLNDAGTIWITLDDNEVHYCKVLCDEIFGRQSFIGTVVWEKADSPRMDAKFFSVRHDYILVYGKNNVSFNTSLSSDIPEHYNQKESDGRLYYTKPLRLMGGHKSDSLYYPILAPDGTLVFPLEPDGSKGCWRWSKQKYETEIERIKWINGKRGWTPYFAIYADSRRPTPIETIWNSAEVGSNRNSKNEIRTLFKTEIFATPKPEKLIEKILNISSNPGDIVLDSFLGSGTTAAVAQKMGRRYIGIELGDHAYTHCFPRLQKVTDGKDNGGITQSQNWQGGGGFKFYELAPSLLKHDEFGNLVINPEYNAEQLAAAMALQEGFTYEPTPDTYWKQGHSSENDYIFTTTQFLTAEALDRIHETMTEDESLLICCTAYQREIKSRYGNITVKKIPKMLLGRCAFDQDNYNLNIVAMPEVEDIEDDDDE